MFFRNAFMRELLLQGYRLYARSVIFLPGPRILINSIPKAGTHLLTSLLDELPKLMLSGRRIQHWQVNKLAQGMADNRMQAFDFDSAAFVRLIRKIHPGQIIFSHLRWDDAIQSILDADDIATLFMVRDPRDVLVSQLFYIKGLPRHPLHQRLLNDYASDAERLFALIAGMPAAESQAPALAPLRERLLMYSGWQQAQGVLTIRFEDLIGSRGDGDAAKQYQAYQRVFDHVRRPADPETIAAISERMQHKSSATFRRGRIGDWRLHFNDDHKATVKQQVGDLLIQWGYESQPDW